MRLALEARSTYGRFSVRGKVEHKMQGKMQGKCNVPCARANSLRQAPLSLPAPRPHRPVSVLVEPSHKEVCDCVRPIPWQKW